MSDMFNESGWIEVRADTPQPPPGSSFMVRWDRETAAIVGCAETRVVNFHGFTCNWRCITHYKPLQKDQPK